MSSGIEGPFLIQFSNPFNKPCELPQVVNYEKVDWSYLLKRARENKVLFPFLQNLLQTCIKIPDTVKERLQFVLENQNRLLQRWIDFLKFSLKLFEESKVDVILIKSLKGYPHCSVDLDFLLRDKEEMRRAARLLVRTGRISYASGDTYSICLRSRSKENSPPIEIDLHQRVSWRKLPSTLFDYDDIWERLEITRHFDVDIPIPSPEDDMLITCAHSLFGHHQYFLGDLFYLMAAFKRGIDTQYIFEETKKLGWSTALYYFLRCSSIFYRHFYDKVLVPEKLLNSMLVENMMTRLIETFLVRETDKDGRIRFPYRYPLACECMVSFERAFSNLNKGDLLAFFKEGSLLMFDNIRTEISYIYDSLTLR